jgi:hypothetical protein
MNTLWHGNSFEYILYYKELFLTHGAKYENKYFLEREGKPQDGQG